ncbi:uncharacterized protein [Montipora capricornis]|uniref:uncharacterized protein isoform X1 n=1 Tax=Montipora capricornis TaxID=246305 RepID=UPI0035F1DA9E
MNCKQVISLQTNIGLLGKTRKHINHRLLMIFAERSLKDASMVCLIVHISCRNNVNLKAANALQFRLPQLSQIPLPTLQMQFKQRSTQQCRPKRYVSFVPAPPSTIGATAPAHRLPLSERFSGLHTHIYRPRNHAGSAVGLHDCLYRGAKIGNLQLREQLAIKLNIWRCFNCSATSARRY